MAAILIHTHILTRCLTLCEACDELKEGGPGSHGANGAALLSIAPDRAVPGAPAMEKKAIYSPPDAPAMEYVRQ